MPTINQLVRKGREQQVTKSTSPALQKTLTHSKERLLNKALRKKEVFVRL